MVTLRKPAYRNVLLCTAMMFMVGACSDTSQKEALDANGDDALARMNITDNDVHTSEAARITDSSAKAMQLRQEARMRPSDPPPETAWDKALDFDDEKIFMAYLLANSELLDDEEMLDYVICKRDASRYKDMSKNEFSFAEFLEAEEAALRRELTEFQKAHKQSDDGDGLYRFRVRIGSKLGDYNFDAEHFDFTPIAFDYLTEDSNRSSRDCGFNSEPHHIAQPREWIDEWRFTFNNKNDVKTLTANRDMAKTVVDGMTNKNNTARNVTTEFVFRADMSDLLIEKPYSDFIAKRDGDIVWMRVLNVQNTRWHNSQDDHDVLGLYPESYFEP